MSSAGNTMNIMVTRTTSITMHFRKQKGPRDMHLCPVTRLIWAVEEEEKNSTLTYPFIAICAMLMFNLISLLWSLTAQVNAILRPDLACLRNACPQVCPGDDLCRLDVPWDHLVRAHPPGLVGAPCHSLPNHSVKCYGHSALVRLILNKCVLSCGLVV